MITFLILISSVFFFLQDEVKETNELEIKLDKKVIVKKLQKENFIKTLKFSEFYEASRIVIIKSQVEKENKPPEILEKMIEGKLNKQLSDVSLLKQPFVKDPSIKIENYLSQAGAEIESFVRLEVGEGIEVEKKDFAEEVKSQLET